MSRRPEPTEYDSYYRPYVDAVPDGDIVEILSREGEHAVDLFLSIDHDRGVESYAAGKWSIAELIGHVVDTERLFSYRTLRIVRGDKTPMPGMEQDDWVAGANFNNRGLESLGREFLALRASNIALYSSFTDEDLDRTGVASELEFSVRALMYILAGHTIHHVKVLEDRYLV